MVPFQFSAFYFLLFQRPLSAFQRFSPPALPLITDYRPPSSALRPPPRGPVVSGPVVPTSSPFCFLLSAFCFSPAAFCILPSSFFLRLWPTHDAHSSSSNVRIDPFPWWLNWAGARDSTLKATGCFRVMTDGRSVRPGGCHEIVVVGC